MLGFTAFVQGRLETKRILTAFMGDNFSFCNEETASEVHPMSIAESAFPPELPPMSVLSPVTLRHPGECSETRAGNVERATAGAESCVRGAEACRDKVFEGMVGKREALQRTLQELEVVAPTDSGVLILGE